jgi:hypothetical protein
MALNLNLLQIQNHKMLSCSNFKYYIEGAKQMYTHLSSSNDNRASAIFFDWPACRMVTLAFVWLTPSFERTSYYTLLP